MRQVNLQMVFAKAIFTTFLNQHPDLILTVFEKKYQTYPIGLDQTFGVAT